jgi:transcriptional regulator GlxA family with amidase domain
MPPQQTQPISVLLIPYPQFNTLDLNGPLEILGNAFLSAGTFTVTIAAKETHTTAYENVIVKRHISLSEAHANLSSYDILIQPGGGPDSIVPHLKDGDDHFKELLDVVTAFSKLGPSPRGERVLMSICTGALFLGYAGVFDGLEATTHFLALDSLRTICGEYVARTPGAKETKVLPESLTQKVRQVDAGLNEHGVRIISSGGISCGLDATLHLVSRRLGNEFAVGVANMMEYAWRAA